MRWISPPNTLPLVFLLSGLLSAPLFGESLPGQVPPPATARPKKILTPDQKAYQAEAAQWRMEQDALRTQAQAALVAEQARAQKSDCPGAVSTLDAEQCLSREITTTGQNYAAFTGALRKLLAHTYPRFPGEPSDVGPSGSPPTSEEKVAEFDRLEAESKSYREHASAAAYNQFKGGTEAPVFALEADQKLSRSHLQELAFLYNLLLSNH